METSMFEYRINDLIEEIKETLTLTPLTLASAQENRILTPELIQPGLALAGYFEHFYTERIQVLSKMEVSYLNSISTHKLKNVLRFFQDFNIPCLILAGGTVTEKRIIRIFSKFKISLLESNTNLDHTVMTLSMFLHERFAKSISLHGVLMDVFGVGILITGMSGIGKSECALDLIERRHRLIADDLVIAKQLRGTLVGGSIDSPLKFHLEVRGVGIINVKKLFGICSVLSKKRIETIVELVEPEDALKEDRSGLTQLFKKVLDINIPLIRLPTSSVSNIAKTIEVIAMRYLGYTIEKGKLENYNEKLIELFEQKDKQS